MISRMLFTQQVSGGMRLFAILTHVVMNFVMNFLGESIFRVGGAMVVGAVLIGIAFFIQHQSSADENTEVPATVVARGDVRTVQPALDSDKDSIPDWEEVLRGTDPHTYTKPTEATEVPATTTDPYTPPTTVTDRFAEQFLEDIVRSGAGTDITEEDKAQLVSKSISTLTAETKDRLYTRADIKSVADNDLAALHTYGNELSTIIGKPATTNENELLIFERAVVKENNPEVLKELQPIAQAYIDMISGLLLLETPSTLSKQHVDLLNTLVMIHTDIVAMQEAFSDPLRALVRVKRYYDDAQGLFYALDNIRTALEARGVVYTSTEPGIFLFSLRP